MSGGAPVSLALGLALRAYRHRAGLSQRDLGQAARLDPSEICRIEYGERLPSLPALARIAQALALDETEVGALVGCVKGAER